jgi:hypothetical protein
VNVVAMVLDRPSQSIVLEKLHPRNNEQVTRSVAVHQLVGELPIVILFHETKRHTGLSSSQKPF